LDNYALKRKIIVYIKDEGFDLNTMTWALKSIVSCDGFGKKKISTCFGYAFSKTCQYATIDEKVYIDTICVN
jgi:hypothetical protein